MRLIYKCLNGLAPPPLMEFIKAKRDTGRETRSSAMGDCVIGFRKTAFCQNILSIKGCNYWNQLPGTIRDIPTYTAFKGQLKQWLKQSQQCNHP